MILDGRFVAEHLVEVEPIGIGGVDHQVELEDARLFADDALRLEDARIEKGLSVFGFDVYREKPSKHRVPHRVLSLFSAVFPVSPGGVVPTPTTMSFCTECDLTPIFVGCPLQQRQEVYH